MACKPKRILKPDLSNESQEYWEKVLESHNLSMDRGLLPPDLVSYVGNSQNVEGVLEEHFRVRHGKFTPPGYGPDY